MRTTVKHRITGSIILGMVLFLFVGCGPAPTIDQAALEATITARIIVTQTASAPTATNTPANTATPTFTPTPTNTPTPAVTNTPTATGTPTPTATPDILSLVPAKRKFNHLFKITTEYDKFKDRTFITLNYIPSSTTKPDDLYVYWSYPGTDLAIPDRVYMSFISSSKDWQFLSVRAVEMVLDNNQRVRFDATRDGQVGSGYVIEEMDTILTLPQFLPIVNAKQVDVRIGSVEFSLSGAQLEGLRDLASRMNP